MPVSPEELRHQQVLADRAAQARPESIEGWNYKLRQLAEEKGSFAPGTPGDEAREAIRQMAREQEEQRGFARAAGPGLQEALNRSWEEDLADFIEPTGGMSETEVQRINQMGGLGEAVDEARAYGHLARLRNRGQAIRSSLGRLGQRAMQIPGVEPAMTMGRTAGRYLGPALGVAGPVFDAMAIKELMDQYGEAKEGIRHMEATKMHTAKNYPTTLAAKQTRKRRQERAASRERSRMPYSVQQTMESPESGIYISPEERFGR